MTSLKDKICAMSQYSDSLIIHKNNGFNSFNSLLALKMPKWKVFPHIHQRSLQKTQSSQLKMLAKFLDAQFLPLEHFLGMETQITQ
jgi:hypothetical protein